MPAKRELKLKAYIRDLKKTKEIVKKIAKFKEKKDYTDYFFRTTNPSPASELRLRNIKTEKIITLKILFCKNQIQENIEYEFAVDKADDFIAFLEYIGYKPFCLLRKQSEVYNYKDLKIELVNIQDLGNFIELVLHSKGEFTKEKKDKLQQLALQFNIKKIDIDSRYYSEIHEQRSKK